ncbi:TIGR04104 family putative zinc finger protein [Paraliobacillus sp. JSM ZJ581]|uniref:TIGR04104 family putative zinc finger protein n=1 Tax=Paraliobacillus sp. JSM ZJ581 TaxID=3342118 RepID=UPI0035A8EE8E
MTTCNNCSSKINYKTKMKLQRKNIFEITCPNCNATLKATRGSLAFYLLVLVLSILFLTNLPFNFWDRVILTVSWFLLLFNFSPFLLRHKIETD